MSLTKEQLRERMNGIGGSDISAIVGLNSFKSIHNVYNEKRGIAPIEEGNAFTEYGDMMEAPLLLRYFNEAGLDAKNFATSNRHAAKMIGCELLEDAKIHPQYEWMRALVDGLVLDDNGRPTKIVEGKTAHWRMADKWGISGTDQIPEEYLCQVAWYMAIYNTMGADVVALVDRDFRVYPVQRDMAFEKSLIARGELFWKQNVVPGIAPEVDDSDACTHGLAVVRETEHEIESTAEMDTIVDDIKATDRIIKSTTKEQKTLKNKLAALLGNKGRKIVGAWGSYAWTNPGKKTVIDWQALAISKGATKDEIDEHSKEVPTQKPSFRPYWRKEPSQ